MKNRRIWNFAIVSSMSLLYSSLGFAGDDWSMNNHWNFYADYLCMGRKNKLIRDRVVIYKREDISSFFTPATPVSSSSFSSFVSDSSQVSSGPAFASSSSISSFSSYSSSICTQGYCVKDKLNTRHLLKALGQESGFRLGGVYMTNTWSLEASFVHPWQWHSKTNVNGYRNLLYPFDSGSRSSMRRAFSNASSGYGEYKSNFWTSDLNYWRHVTPRRMDYFSFSWIAGVRYAQLDEKTRTVLIKGNSRKSQYGIETKNYMPGPQAGLNIQVNPYRQWSWDFTGKIAGLFNFDEQKTEIWNRKKVFISGKSQDTAGTLFMQLSAALTWHFFRHANVHCGYEVFYLTGVALAPERYKNTTSRHAIVTVKTGGQVCLYDAFGGLTIGF